MAELKTSKNILPLNILLNEGWELIIDINSYPANHTIKYGK